MEKKKFSIELPKGGMSDLTKQVRNAGRVQKRLRTWRMCLAV